MLQTCRGARIDGWGGQNQHQQKDPSSNKEGPSVGVSLDDGWAWDDRGKRSQTGGILQCVSTTSLLASSGDGSIVGWIVFCL